MGQAHAEVECHWYQRACNAKPTSGSKRLDIAAHWIPKSQDASSFVSIGPPGWSNHSKAPERSMSVSSGCTTSYQVARPNSHERWRPLLVLCSSDLLSSLPSNVSCVYVQYTKASSTNSTMIGILVYSGSVAKLEHTFEPCAYIWGFS